MLLFATLTTCLALTTLPAFGSAEKPSPAYKPAAAAAAAEAAVDEYQNRKLDTGVVEGVAAAAASSVQEAVQAASSGQEPVSQAQYYYYFPVTEAEQHPQQHHQSYDRTYNARQGTPEQSASAYGQIQPQAQPSTSYATHNHQQAQQASYAANRQAQPTQAYGNANQQQAPIAANPQFYSNELQRRPIYSVQGGGVPSAFGNSKISDSLSSSIVPIGFGLIIVAVVIGIVAALFSSGDSAAARALGSTAESAGDAISWLLNSYVPRDRDQLDRLSRSVSEAVDMYTTIYSD